MTLVSHHTGSYQRSPAPHSLASHSREPSPSPAQVRGESSIATPTPTRGYPEEPRAGFNTTVRSPPTVYTVGEDVRLPRYLRAMSDITSEVGSESSYTNDRYSASIAPSSSSVSTNIPDDWLFPIYLTLEDLYICKTHRFKINRHLLSGMSKEGVSFFVFFFAVGCVDIEMCSFTVYVDVSVQPNWRDGTQLRCKGLGNEREGLPPQVRSCHPLSLDHQP
jgi:hypothetical protein